MMFKQLIDKYYPVYAAFCVSLNIPITLPFFLIVVTILYFDLKTKIKFADRDLHTVLRIIANLILALIILVVLFLEIMGKVKLYR